MFERENIMPLIAGLIQTPPVRDRWRHDPPNLAKAQAFVRRHFSYAGIACQPILHRFDQPRMGEAGYLRGHSIWLRFSDGLAGEIDLQNELIGPVFEPLRDPEIFRDFRLDSELRTLVWPNGADFAPQFLRARLRGAA